MAAKGKQTLYNRCKRCGIMVRRGIRECPECREEIIDAYGFAGLLLKHPERGIYAFVGMLIAFIPLAIVALVLNDPTVGFLDLGQSEIRSMMLLFVLLGGVTGWFWPGILEWLRERE